MYRRATLLATLVALTLSASPAEAAKCDNCPQEGPQGPGGVTLTALSPTVVTGTFRYVHPLSASAPKPIRGAAVKVVADGPFQVAKADTITDAMGRFRVSLPYDAGATYRVDVLAVNDAALVFDETSTIPLPFRAPALNAAGAVRLTTISTSGMTLDYSTDFGEPNTAGHFNIAEVILRGREYADAHRDPGETDAIGRVPVSLGTFPSPVSWYNPIGGGTINLDRTQGFEDVAILHEYAHVLEDRIGALLALPTTHTACTTTILGVDVRSPELAWMEGFADWFAQTVDPSPTGTPDLGTPSRRSLESTPDCRSSSPGTRTDAFEGHVAGFLWDLYDATGDVSASPDDDTFSRMDTEIFQIMDRELDGAASGPLAQITTFRDAWYARGLGWFDPLLTQNHIHTYDNSRRAPDPVAAPTPHPKICKHDPDHPGC